MHIIGAAFEISFITYGMLPKALLPKRIFAAMIAGNWSARSDDAGRQCQDCMQVVRENDDGIGKKRPFASRFPKGRTQ